MLISFEARLNISPVSNKNHRVCVSSNSLHGPLSACRARRAIRSTTRETLAMERFSSALRVGTKINASSKLSSADLPDVFGGLYH